MRDLLGDFPPAKPFAEQVTATFEGGPIGALGNTQALGFELFSTYLLPFEVISIVLLLAVVGAIVLAKRQLR